jgi:archaellum biogenesis ATPase FlaH
MRGSTEKVLHSPQLDTILMVERAIKNAKDYPTRTELWRSLPRKMQYQTFKIILDYLEASNKIVFNGKTIVWTAADNPKLRRFLQTAVSVS